MLRTLILFLALIIVLPVNLAAKQPIQIFVSVLPQKFFVEKIGGDRVNVDVLVAPGKNPATYSPKISQIKKLSLSKIYFRIGVPFENGFMHKIESIAKNVKIVDTRKGIRLRDMEEHHHEDEDHDEDKHNHDKHEDDHDDHTGKDPHIWTSPALVMKQAKTIYNELVKTDPAGKDHYSRNYKSFIAELKGLHRDIQKALAPVKGSSFFVFHPAFGYFADEYGIKQIAVESMGKAPKGRKLFKIIQRAKKEKARVIFVQPQFDRHTARKIAGAINGAVVSINPLAYDYISNMREMAKTVLKGLSGK